MADPTGRQPADSPDPATPIARSVSAGGEQPVLVVMGVSGSGKSTVAALLAGQLGWDLGEGDDMHPDENVQKMADGVPLTDEDRWPWLETIASWITEHTMAGIPGIVTCSALRRSYRMVLRGTNVVFVFLSGDGARIGRRMAARTGHFMPSTLLQSQLATLEPPTPDENYLLVDISMKPAQVAAEIIRRLALRPDVGSSGLESPRPGESSVHHTSRSVTDTVRTTKGIT